MQFTSQGPALTTPHRCVFQAEPTVRVVFPSARAGGQPRCDAEYFHQPGELTEHRPQHRPPNPRGGGAGELEGCKALG